MIRHAQSHVDHVSAAVLAHVLERFKNRTEAFKETFTLPSNLSAECGLHGPRMGDAPLAESEVFHAMRGNRENLSRLCNRPKRPAPFCTVIAGPHDGHACVLFTVFGGPITPREPTESGLTDAERKESEEFWKDHALSV